MKDAPTVRAILILVNQGSSAADVYIQDDSGWFHLHVSEQEALGDVRDYVDSREYRQWPQERPAGYTRDSYAMLAGPAPTRHFPS
jgi:hypothetical protein